jgi:phage FluMu protein Com
MPITATCPSCSQMCQVEDQYAGMMVRCPKCGNIIQVARPGEAPVQTVPPAATPMPMPAAPPDGAPPPPSAPPGPAGPGFMETIQQSFIAFSLDPLSQRLLYTGVACLAGCVLFTFIPWIPLFDTAPRVMSFLLSAGAIAFLIVSVVVLKKRETFDVSLWVAGAWSVMASIWRLADLAQWGSVAGVGLYLALLASFGAAGSFGFIIYNRMIKQKLK